MSPGRVGRGAAEPAGGSAGAPAFLELGGVEEQAGEKLDRLGLLPTGEADKPRTAEPTVLVQKRASFRSNERRSRSPRQGAQRHAGSGRRKNLPTYKGPKQPQIGQTPAKSATPAKRRRRANQPLRRPCRGTGSRFLTSEVHSLESCRDRRRSHETCRSRCRPTCQRCWHHSATTRATASSPPARPYAGKTLALPSFSATPRIPDHPVPAFRTEPGWSGNKGRASKQGKGRAGDGSERTTEEDEDDVRQVPRAKDD